MKLTQLLVLPIVCVFGTAFVAPGGALGFHVEAKTKLTKTFTSKLVVDCDEFSMSVDGNEMPMGDHAPKIHVEETEKVQVTDLYVSVGDGRATKLERTYDELGSESLERTTPPAVSGGEEREKKRTKTCELEGKTVVFTWNDKEDEYVAAWKEGEKGADTLLENLAGDMDLLGALPDKTVADGDTWELDPQFFNRILQPAGVLVMKTEGDEENSDAESMDAELQFAKSRGGKATATYKGLRDDGGTQVAVIEVKAKLTASASVERDEANSDVVLEADLTGEITWDVEKGHYHSVELSGATKMKIENKRTIEREGESHALVQTLAFSGDFELALNVK